MMPVLLQCKAIFIQNLFKFFVNFWVTYQSDIYIGGVPNRTDKTKFNTLSLIKYLY